MSLIFNGKIKVIETRDSLYFDVVDEDTGASFNKFLKTLKEHYPDIRVKIEISPNDPEYVYIMAGGIPCMLEIT